MVGLFGTLGTATSGMGANQIALQTSSHNIANTNTDGYSRQRVDMKTTTPYNMAGVGMIGTGVEANGVERVVNDFVRSQIREANAQYQFYNEKSDVLGQLEDTLNEPSDSGVVSQLSKLSDSWTQLSKNPEMGTSKATVVETASSFADTVREMADKVGKLKADTTQNIAKTALDFNEKIKQLQSLNEQVYNLNSSGETPNDLLDTRDNLLKDISSLANVTTAIDRYGRASIQLSGQTILNGDERNTLSVVVGTQNGQAAVAKDGDTTTGTQTLSGDYAAGTILLTKNAADGNAAFTKLDVPSGSLGGLQASVNEIQTHLQELNDFAATVAKTTNMVFSDGKQSTSGFFSIGNDPASYAANLKVDSTLALIHHLIPAGTTSAAGDGSRALAIANLNNLKLNYPFSDSDLASYDKTNMTFAQKDGGSSYADAFNNIVTKNGISKQQADNTSSAQLSLLNQLEYKNESMSGVSINEEMSDVIRFQQGFQANARIISVVSEMLDTLINRTGV
ncbi:LOW QUALITY PROTEIN: flagellar hook-associated protein FlgK [Liquorilactobacillus sucicola DSM 21376 = JCM 15457]|nr:LOW QUALITY PROTEIN: flagellar hook-associated protein FlgK [Liquorilactobacillus sucicola DSM 21376 = JCM 15457]